MEAAHLGLHGEEKVGGRNGGQGYVVVEVDHVGEGGVHQTRFVLAFRHTVVTCTDTKTQQLH